MNKKTELFNLIQCALLHDLDVCKYCNKCEGANFAEKRINLINKLKTELKIKDADKQQENKI